MTDSIDPMAMARFLVLPGASRLLEAFASIPPGALRDSVIHHAEVIASQYTGGAVAPIQRGQDQHLRAPPRAPAQITASRTGREPPTESPAAQAVKMRMEGVPPGEIAAHLGIPLKHVYDATFLARKAGMKFPKRELKGVADKKRWITDLDQLTPQGRYRVEQAALLRGIDPQAYLDRRDLTLKMAMEGASWETILKATGEADAKVCSAWLSVARAAGFNVPYVAFVRSETVPPGPTVELASQPEAVGSP